MTDAGWRQRWLSLWASPWSVYVLAALVQVALAPWFAHDWDGFVFVRAATDFLSGRTPYEVAAESPPHVFLAQDWPAPNQWYAYPPLPLLLMTPTIGLSLLAGLDGDAFLRLALKLPLIAGNLALAWLVRRAVLDLGGAPQNARKAELLVLFNPFLVFVGAVWGMFDAWMMVFLVASALLLARGKHAWAGVAFGAATLVKVFPLFVAPAFLIWVLRREPRKAPLFVGSAVGAFALVSLPFFLLSPEGFYSQVVGIHLERPIQGFVLVNLLYLPRFTMAHWGFEPWPVPEGWVGPVLSTTLLLPALVVTYAFATARPPTLRHLLHVTLVGLLFFLLFGKVVNEQYFVMPVALLAILAFAPWSSPRLRQAYHAWTWGGLVAGLLIGFHFVTFLPREVSLALFGMPPGDALHGLGMAATTVGIPFSTFFSLPDVLCPLALAPAFLLSLVLVLQPTREVLGHLREQGNAGRTHARRALAFATVAMLLGAPVTFAATSTSLHEAPVYPPMPPAPERLVGATYYVWWNNPAHDPDRRDGNWGDATLTPAEGFHTVNGHRLERDVDGMLAAGIDFAAVSYHGYDHGRYEVFSKVARAKGLYFAPMVEVGELIGHAGHRAVVPGEAPPMLRPDDASAEALKALTESALRLGGSEAFLRIDGRLVVFLNDAHLVGPSWDDASKRALAREVLERHGGSFANVSAAWGANVATLHDLVARFPADLDAFHARTREAADWRHALDERRAHLLDRVRAASASKIHLVGTERAHFAFADDEAPFWGERALDGAFAGLGAGPAGFRVPEGLARLDAFEDQQRLLALKHPDSAFLVVQHATNDRRGVAFRADPPAFADAWDLARETGAKRVLLASWNNFFDGTAVAPTREHGTRALDAMREAIARFKAGPDDARPARLVAVNERGSILPEGKDWTFELAWRLPLALAKADPAARVRVADLAAHLPEGVEDPARFASVWVEVGSGRLDAEPHVLRENHARLLAHAHRGGSLVLLGGGVPKPFEDAYFAVGEGGVEGPARVVWPGGETLVPASDRTLRVRAHEGCETLATLEPDGTPAAWRCPLGEGLLVGASLRPQTADAPEPFLRYISASAEPGRSPV